MQWIPYMSGSSDSTHLPSVAGNLDIITFVGNTSGLFKKKKINTQTGTLGTEIIK
jgi:hypothetical protein